MVRALDPGRGRGAGLGGGGAGRARRRRRVVCRRGRRRRRVEEEEEGEGQRPFSPSFFHFRHWRCCCRRRRFPPRPRLEPLPGRRAGAARRPAQAPPRRRGREDGLLGATARGPLAAQVTLRALPRPALARPRPRGMGRLSPAGAVAPGEASRVRRRRGSARGAGRRARRRARAAGGAARRGDPGQVRFQDE